MPGRVQNEDEQYKQTHSDVEDFNSQWSYMIGSPLWPEFLLLLPRPIASQSPRLVDAQYRDAEEQHDGECGFLRKLFFVRECLSVK